jgi:fumarate hydratase subunit alpha/L(+)-tartrate dehydratase alpha subunit
LISEAIIKKAVSKIFELAQKELPADVVEALRQAGASEASENPRGIVDTIIENARIAADRDTLICQDTGVASYFIKIGQHAKIEGDLKQAIYDATKEVTASVPLIPHSVNPITRCNSGTGTGPGIPIMHFDYISGADYLEITAMPVGAGSENVSQLKMFTSSNPFSEIKAYIVKVVAESGSRSCPPLVVGVGLGGQFENAAKLAKMAAYRPLNNRHPEAEIAALEEELKIAINRLGIGPMGLGGQSTALAVNVEYSNTHTPNMPVAVKILCWAARRATARISADGAVTYSQ